MSSSEKLPFRTDRGRAVRATVSDIHKDIKRICPICSVSVGDWSDKSTWRIDFRDEATEEQRRKALAMVARIKIEYLRPGTQPVQSVFRRGDLYVIR